MNPFAILYVLGSLLLFTSFMLLIPIPWSLYYGDSDIPAFLISSGIALAAGGPLSFFFRRHRSLQIKDGFVIVTAGWILVSAVSAFPFVIHGFIPSFTDAFFEMMSGYTTTGASILPRVEAAPHGLLFWRSMTHFIGGMGIIMLTLMVLPLLGMGGMQLYKAEASPGQGPASQRLATSIRKGAQWLWAIYLGINLLQTLLLWAAGMSLFDALCHSFGTVATGGYSTYTASLAQYENPVIHWIVTVFMALGGVNFLLYYCLLFGDWRTIRRNTELKWYLLILLGLCSMVSLLLWYHHQYPTLSENIRHGFFQVVSILTTTGFITADYELWPQSAQMFILLSMFVGACSGSTTSGIKIIQMVILWKYLHAMGKRLLQPLAVVPIRVNSEPVDDATIAGVVGYFVVNIVIVFIGGAVMVLITHLDYWSSIASVMATLWNIGPGFGKVGPSQTFAPISDMGKWFLSFIMLAGRLDIFTLLVMFYPSFWKK